MTTLPRSACFDCELNCPDVRVTWYKDNQPLQPSDRVQIEAEGVVHRLTIKDVTAADVADYSINADNAGRSVARLSFRKCFVLSLVY